MRIKFLLPLLTLAVFLSCNTAQKAQTSPLPAVALAKEGHQSPIPAVALAKEGHQSPIPAVALAKEGHQSPILPPFVTWDKKMVDLGKVKKGEKRTLYFELTNTSGQDIQIEIVDACECTKVDYPRGTIAPGGKGHFDVIFDSTEKDASETIGITVVFKQSDAAGNPRIESVEYKYELDK